jgi:hypothetical protein
LSLGKFSFYFILGILDGFHKSCLVWINTI